MCLGEISRVVGLAGDSTAEVETQVRRLRVSLLTLQTPVEVGDWVLVHSGFALERLEPEAALEALRIRAERPRPES